MLLVPDDEISTVNSVFLGPSGYTLPWMARYSAYGIGFAIGVVVFIIEHRLGIRLGFFTLAWSLIIVILLTRAAGRVISYETPLRAVAAMFWHEISAPRGDTKPTSVVLRPGAVPWKKGTRPS